MLIKQAKTVCLNIFLCLSGLLEAIEISVLFHSIVIWWSLLRATSTNSSFCAISLFSSLGPSDQRLLPLNQLRCLLALIADDAQSEKDNILAKAEFSTFVLDTIHPTEPKQCSKTSCVTVCKVVIVLCPSIHKTLQNIVATVSDSWSSSRTPESLGETFLSLVQFSIVLWETLQKIALASWEVTAPCMSLPLKIFKWIRGGGEDGATDDPKPM